MKCNIVFEGAKGTGKSTLSSYFLEGRGYVHSSSETKNDLKYHLDLLRNRFERDGNSLIIDRFSVGEMIYPSIYGRTGRLNWKDFVKTMSDEDTVYVILYSSSPILLKERIQNRGRNTLDENLESVYKSNEMFKIIGEGFHDSKNVLLFDIAKMEKKDILNEIKEKVEELEYVSI